MVRSTIDFFERVFRVLQRDAMTPFLIIICLYRVLQTSNDLLKENGLTLKRQEANTMSQNLLLMQTTQMI